MKGEKKMAAGFTKSQPFFVFFSHLGPSGYLYFKSFYQALGTIEPSNY